MNATLARIRLLSPTIPVATVVWGFGLRGVEGDSVVPLLPLFPLSTKPVDDVGVKHGDLLPLLQRNHRNETVGMVSGDNFPQR